jgi:hypothetical protein
MTDKVLSLSRKGHLSAEFLTQTYRISGEINLKGQPFVDLLNDKMSTFIRIENAYVSPIDDPTVFKAQAPSAVLRKDTIALVILSREEDGVARHTLYHIKPDAPVLFNVFSVIHGFEVHGGLKLSSPVDIDNLIMQNVDRFITLYRATATLAANADIQFYGGSLLLNREMANLYTIEKAT